MTSSAPTITVVTPSYNQGAFLERTIRSVIGQSYPSLEFILLDAGSRDESPEIIERYKDCFAHWAIAPDRGQSDAIVKAWSMSRGDILAWLNSDDIYYPDALAEVGEVFARSPNTIMLCGTIAIVDEHGRRLRLKKPPRISARRLLPWGRVPGQPAVFLRREVFEKVGGPRLDLHYVMDWEFWLRIALAYSENRVAYSRSVMAASREWPQTKTLTAGGKDAEEVRRVLTELFEGDHLPAELRAMRREAFARSWWRQSRNAHKALRYGESLWCLLRALRISPFGLPMSRVIRHALRIVFHIRPRRST